MKSTIKLILVLISVAIVVGLVWLFWDSIVPPPPPPPSSSDSIYINKIDTLIDSLSKVSEATFCVDLYKSIKSDIGIYKSNSKFDSIPDKNEKKADNLLQTLDGAYFSKFTAQVFRVFDGSEWENGKLNIISTETVDLKKSRYLDDTGRAKLKEIEEIISKYWWVQRYINDLNAYLDHRSFNINHSKDYLTNAANLESEHLQNAYVNNVTRFHDALRSVPQRAYRKHLNYIKNRVRARFGDYRAGNYSGNTWALKTNDYRDKIYDPIVAEMNSFQAESGIYGSAASSINTDLSTIKSDWDKELRDAMDYFKRTTP
jgi:hypothetical protein